MFRFIILEAVWRKTRHISTGFFGIFNEVQCFWWCNWCNRWGSYKTQTFVGIKFYSWIFFGPNWNEQMALFDNSAGSKVTLKTFKKQPVLQNMDLLAENQSRAGSDMWVAKMPTGGHVQLNHMTKTSAASQTNPNQTLCRYIPLYMFDKHDHHGVIMCLLF